MKKLFAVVFVVVMSAMCGCHTSYETPYKTSYDVTRATSQDKRSTYYHGPGMNGLHLTYDVIYDEFKLWLFDPPAGDHVVDESDNKYILQYHNSLEDEERYIVLTKKYLLGHIESGLCFRQAKKEYKIPGFYVEGFLDRVPAWTK